MPFIFSKKLCMKWFIDNKRFDMTDLMINIEFLPENKPLRYFLSGVNLIKYPNLLNSTFNQDDFYLSSMSLRFYKNLDWEDLQELDQKGNIKEDELVVYHEVYGDVIIKESLFSHILVDYSSKLIEAYKDDRTLPAQWSEDVLKGIKQLKKKMKHHV